MFTSELDRRALPSDRAVGIFVGSVVLALIVAASISARTIAFTTPALFAAYLAAAAWSGRLRAALPASSRALWWWLVFLGYVSLSIAWAVDTPIAVLAAGAALLIVLSTASLIQLVAGETRPNLLHLGEGLWMGALVASCFLLFELLTGQALTRFVLNALAVAPDDISKVAFYTWEEGRIAAISPQNMTRNLAPVSLFLWPALAAIAGCMPRSRATIIGGMLFVTTLAAAMLSWHESSKLAILAGAAIFALARWSPLSAYRLTCLGWIVACLGVIPAVLGAHDLDWHNASWLPSSAQHRVVIWNYTAEQALKSPVIGVGVRSTRDLGAATEGSIEGQPGERYQRSLSLHAHNIYLQTWFELGAVGALLLSLAGLALIRTASLLPAGSQPYAFAAFVGCAVMASSSYGMWQYWFMSMFGLVAVFMAIGVRLMATAPTALGDRGPQPAA